MKLDVRFEETESFFPVTMLDDEVHLDVKFESLQVLHIDDAEYYEGSTFFVPDFVGTMFETANKKIRTNILVSRIPVNTVTNPQGGNTVIIGG